MSTTTHITDHGLAALTERAWKLDPEASVAKFEVTNYWGLAKVRGSFGRLRGGVDLRDPERPAAELWIQAASLDTGNRRRDEHLRSEEFFDVATHPEVSFVASRVVVHKDRAAVTLGGELCAAGRAVGLELEASVASSDDGLELSGETVLDQRRLGMDYSPLGMIRPTSRLSVRARLVADGAFTGRAEAA